MAGGDSLVNTLIAMTLVTNFDIATSTICIWDYILTFRMEVDLVWKSKWNVTKGLFLLQRYLPFIDTWLIVHYQIGGNLTKNACRNLYYASGVIMHIGLSTSEIILALRTWAVWNRNRRLTIILPTLYVLFFGSGFIILFMFHNSIAFGDPPYPGYKGCLPTHSDKYYLLLLWVILIIWDTLMLMLMLVPGIRTFRFGGNSALIQAVYRDGVIYYLYVFALSFINVVLTTILTPQYQLLITPMELVLHSILTSRVILHIRAQAEESPVCSDGLTRLDARNGETGLSCLEPLKFSTTKRSSL